MFRLFCTYFLLVSGLISIVFQQSVLAQDHLVPTPEELISIENMRKDGVSEAEIDRWMIERKVLGIKNQVLNPKDKSNSLPIGFCGDLGGEFGWGAWEASTGNYQNGNITITAQGLQPTAPRFTLMNGNGVDACTPGTAPGAPPISYVAPWGFGNRTIRLGQPETTGSQGGCSGGCVERLEFDMAVTANDTNFVYAYAIILQNPPNIHTGKQVPYAEIYITDGNGDTIPCSYHKYIGDTTGNNVIQPGMWQANCNTYTVYQPWTIYGLNLVNYIGQVVKVHITNADCGLGGHYCHSYWDFVCPPVNGNMWPYCIGQSTTLVGPDAFPGVNYNYTWYQNNQIYTGPPSATSQTITPTPNPGDTFAVYVQLPSGCNYWIPFAPVGSTVLPDFGFEIGECGRVVFTDSSEVSPPSTTNSVTAWNWQFPGGTPSFSNMQNPDTVVFPPGTYTVTLIATSAEGCADTIEKVINVPPPQLVAAFVPNIPCLGDSSFFTDGTATPQGDPIVAWNWNMPGGSPAQSTSQNASTVFGAPGSHTVTLIVTSKWGCKDTVEQPVLVYKLPIANFTGYQDGCAPVCLDYKDSSQAVEGQIVSWQWTFPGGNPGSSTVQDPTSICYLTPGTYSVSLVVTTNYGCVDSVELGPTVEVYPWPTADFCIIPDKAPVTDPVFSFCDLSSSDVVGWYWNFGDNEFDSTNAEPVHSYSAVVTDNDFYSFQICLRAETQHGCWDTTCKIIEILPDFTFYIPNTFTPNGDYKNEYFFGKSRGVKDYNIWIFDRWGNQIWDCHYTDDNVAWDKPGIDGLAAYCQWDGKVVPGGVDMGGDSRLLVQEDVYIYKVVLTDVFGFEHKYVGHVNVVR